MSSVFDEIVKLQDEGEIGALSTIISSKGSLPMSGRSKMLVKSDGTFVGTVGGGCLEADVWAASQEVIECGAPKTSNFVLTEKEAGESGLTCGGRVSIFTEPVLPAAMTDIYKELLRIHNEDGKVALATIVQPDKTTWGEHRKVLMQESGRLIGSFGHGELEERVVEACHQSLDDNLPRSLTVDLSDDEAQRLDLPPQVEVFIEPFFSQPVMHVFGGGHVSKFISKVAHLSGFKVIVIDDRPMFANPERFPEAAQTIVEEFEQAFDQLRINERSYVVVVTRGHQWDAPILEQIYHRGLTPCYLGMIGSKAKKKVMWRQLKEKGLPQGFLDTVHSPIGLNIGADTPGEIAVSVVAECVQTRRGTRKRLNF